jgi:bacteriocin biosynthesis cyclodehydratase domain-containing protein
VENRSFRLPRHFELITSAEGGHRLVSLTSSLRVRSSEQDDLLARILPLLAEGASLDTLLSVSGDGDGGRVLAILDELRSRDLLEEMSAEATGDAEPNAEQERFFANFLPLGAEPPGLDANGAAAPAQRKLAEARVLVTGLGRTGSRLVRSLAHAGIGSIWGADPGVVTDMDLQDGGYDRAARGKVREQALGRVVEGVDHRVSYNPLETAGMGDPVGWRLPEGLNLLIICDEGFDPERYDSINRLCLQHDLSWISYRSLGARYEIGPTIVPRQTACFHCLELRRIANSDSYETHRDAWRALAMRSVGLGSLNVTFGADLLALEAIKILTGFSRPVTYGSLFTLDLLTFEATVHPVLKIPRCPQCSPAATQRPALIIWPPGDGFEDS